jgi:hypothetical protein
LNTNVPIAEQTKTAEQLIVATLVLTLFLQEDLVAKQYHYVVCYDAETNEFTLDYDTMSAKFDDEVIYNTETEEWEDLQESDWENDNSDYNLAGDLLYKIVSDLGVRKYND